MATRKGGRIYRSTISQVFATVRFLSPSPADVEEIVQEGYASPRAARVLEHVPILGDVADALFAGANPGVEEAVKHGFNIPINPLGLSRLRLVRLGMIVWR